MNLDPAIVARYYRDIPGANMDTVQGQYTFPCDSNMPDLNLVIGGVGIKIHGRVLNYHPFDAQANSKYFVSASSKTNPNVLCTPLKRPANP